MSISEQELDALLRSMRDVEVPADALPEDALDELRRGVRARIRRGRQRCVLTWCASAAATVVVGLTIAPLWQSLPKLDARAPRIAVAELAWQRGSVNVQTVRPQTPGQRSAGKTQAEPVKAVQARPRFEVAEQPGFIRVVTRDPDVVLLWAMDEIKVEEETEKSEKKGVTR